VTKGGKSEWGKGYKKGEVQEDKKLRIKWDSIKGGKVCWVVGKI